MELLTLYLDQHNCLGMVDNGMPPPLSAAQVHVLALKLVTIAEHVVLPRLALCLVVFSTRKY